MAKSVTTPLPELPLSESLSPTFNLMGQWTWRTLILLLTGLVLFLAWLVAYGDLYKPGSRLGYNLGLVGGIIMLTLLVYPLRKRIPALERLGSMRSWFRYHMVFGIAGPVLVMFHSTFKSGSMNGRVALYAMILVTVSGIVGRFVYRQVHIGLYGRELTLADAEQELMTSSEGVNSTFVFHPEILGRLKSFREAAFAEMNSIPRRTWRFCSMGWRGKILVHSIRDMVQKELVVTAKRNNWSGSQTKLGYQLAMQQIERYVVAVSKAARYSTWQYIFSFWHLIHLPFLYLLVLSGIFHVIAVHMY